MANDKKSLEAKAVSGIPKNTSYVGYRIKFWLYSEDDPFIGNCLSIFKEGDSYFYGINFDGDEVLGVNIADIRMIKRVKKINHQLEVVYINDLRPQKIDPKKEPSNDN